jgi:hypothetical protein
MYDEIAINQESQIVPVYLLVLDPVESKQFQKKWQRETKEPLS